MDMEPDHPAGQFYVGLAQLQGGNEAGAKAVWLALADRSAEDAPWMPLVRRQLAALGVTPPNLSSEDLNAVNSMTTEEREIFIQSMMQRLEDRLESSPNDPDGWAMLARSQLAMGDKNAAIETLKRGISSVSGEKSADLQAFLDNLLTNSDL
jgi:cytochrome c-type biogenesis protein CcmH